MRQKAPMHHLDDADSWVEWTERFATRLNRQRTNGEDHRGRPSHVLANRLSLHLGSSKLERHRPDPDLGKGCSHGRQVQKSYESLAS